MARSKAKGKSKSKVRRKSKSKVKRKSKSSAQPPAIPVIEGGATEAWDRCFHCSWKGPFLQKHRGRTRCGSSELQGPDHTCRDCSLTNIPRNKKAQHKSGGGCRDYKLLVSGRQREEDSSSDADGLNSGTGDDQEEEDEDEDEDEDWMDVEGMNEEHTDAPNPDDEADARTDNEMEEHMIVEEAMEDAGLKHTTCRFFNDFVFEENLSNAVVNKLLKFIHKEDVKQLPSNVGKMRKMIDDARGVSGKDPRIAVRLPAKLLERIKGCGIPEKLVNKMIGQVVDLKHIITDLFTRHSYLEMGKLRLEGGKAVDEEGHRIYGHPSTADAWLAEERVIRKKYRDFKHEGKAEKVFLAGLIFYSDKTNRRTLNGRPYYPMYVTLANFEADVFFQTATKATVGFIPYTRPPDGCARWSAIYDQVFMYMWKAVLDNYHQAIASEPLQIVCKDGTNLFVCPRMLSFVGDHPELQLVCGCLEAWDANQPCRVCLQFFKGYGSFGVKPKGDVKRTVADMKEARSIYKEGKGLVGEEEITLCQEDRNQVLQRFGLRPLGTAFYHVKFQARQDLGIHARTASDWMHQLLGGLVADTNRGIGYLFDLCNPGGQTKQQKLATQAELNMRFSSMPNYLCPETGHRVKVFNSGHVLSLTYITSQEHLALLWNWRYIIMGEGHILKDPHYERVVELLKALEEAIDFTYYNQGLTKSEVEEGLREKWQNVEECQLRAFVFTEKVDDGEGGTVIQSYDFYNFHKPKQHALKHFGLWIKLLGALLFQNTSPFEHNHIAVVKGATMNDNGKGGMEERIINDTARAEFNDLCLRIGKQGNQSTRRRQTKDCYLNPRLGKHRVQTLQDFAKMKLGKPCSEKDVQHCLGLFHVLLAGEIADEHGLWTGDGPPETNDEWRDFFWRIKKDNILPEAFPAASQVFMHTCLKSSIPANESPSGEAIEFHVRANPKWQKTTRLYDFVELVVDKGQQPIYAQVLLLFTARYNDPMGQRQEKTGVFIHDLLECHPIEEAHDHTDEIQQETYATLMNPRDKLLKFKEKWGFRVLPLKDIKRKVYVTPDFNWARRHDPRRGRNNDLYTQEALPKWMLWGWMPDLEAQVVLRDITHRHHYGLR